MLGVLQEVLWKVEGVDVAILEFIQEWLTPSVLLPFWRIVTLLGNGGAFWVALGIILFVPPKTRRTGAMALTCMGNTTYSCSITAVR